MDVVFTSKAEPLYGIWHGDWKEELPEVSCEEVEEIYSDLCKKLGTFGDVAEKAWERADIAPNPDPPRKRMVELVVSKQMPGLLKFLENYLASYKERHGAEFVCIIDYLGGPIITIFPTHAYVVYFSDSWGTEADASRFVVEN